MTRPPPRSTRADTPLPYTALCRSAVAGAIAVPAVRIAGPPRSHVNSDRNVQLLREGPVWLQAGIVGGNALVLGHHLAQHLEHSACMERTHLGGAACFAVRSEEHKSELQSIMRIPYAVFCLTK